MGSRNEATIADWLKVQISAQKDNPLASLNDILYQRRSEQRIRVFLEDTYGPILPKVLRPQPSVIIVDQAEELLRAYRAEFLLFFYNLVKGCLDNNLYKLVLVVNSENSINALKLLNGGNMFDVMSTKSF